MEALGRISVTELWLLPVLLTMVFVLVYCRAYYREYIALTANSLVNIRLINQLLKDEKAYSNNAFILLNLAGFLSLGLFLYQAYGVVLAEHSPMKINVFFQLSGIILAVYLLKAIVILGMQRVFDVQLPLDEFRLSLFNINQVLGAVLIPLNLLLAYSVQLQGLGLVVTGFVLIVMALLWRLVLALQIGRRRNLRLYNIFLYLCTLELLPIAVLIKILGVHGFFIAETV